MQRASLFANALVLSFLLTTPLGCGENEGGEGGSTVVDVEPPDGGWQLVDPLEGFTDEHPASCTTGQQWTGGDQESPLMRPGGACIECHQRRGEGPRYAIAGTVFGHPHEADDCYGLDGVLVEIHDAAGHVYTLRTNASGNFYAMQRHLPGLTFPIWARVVRDGRARTMSTNVQTGDCNSCHTANGANNAPGRVLAP